MALPQVLIAPLGTTQPFPASVATSTQVQPGRGVYYGMIVTTSAGGQTTVYDTAGTTAGGTIVGLVVNAAAVAARDNPGVGVAVTNGLLVVQSASSPAVTVVFGGPPPS